VLLVIVVVGHEFRYTVVLFVKLISFFDNLDNNQRQLDSYSLTITSSVVISSTRIVQECRWKQTVATALSIECVD